MRHPLDRSKSGTFYPNQMFDELFFSFREGLLQHRILCPVPEWALVVFLFRLALRLATSRPYVPGDFKCVPENSECPRRHGLWGVKNGVFEIQTQVPLTHSLVVRCYWTRCCFVLESTALARSCALPGKVKRKKTHKRRTSF